MLRRAPVIALCCAAVTFGTATTGTKYALQGYDPLSLLAVELVLATVVLWAVVAVRGYRRPRSIGRVMVLGLFEPALADLGQTAGLTRTSATNGALIMGLECVFVVVLAALVLGERISRPVAVAIGLAVAGLVVLESGDPVVGPGVGDGLVLFGALSAAAYTIVARHLSPEEDPLSVTAVQFTTAAVLAVPAAVGAWASGAERVPTGVDARYVVAAALVGVVGFAGSFVLYNFAIATVEAAPAAIIVNLIPAVGLASAVAWLGEPLTTYAVLGASLICASVAIFAALEAMAAKAAKAARAATADRPVEVSPRAEATVLTLDLRVLVDDVELRELPRSVAAAG